jgi:hypothetical protein
MIMLMILSTLFGAVLGLRFKVFSVFPAIGTIIALTVFIAFAQGGGFGSTLLAIVLTVTGLEVGFLGGAMTRQFIVASGGLAMRGAHDRRTAIASVVPTEKTPFRNLRRFPIAWTAHLYF